MKHNPNVRRGRNRGNGKRYVPLRNQTFESNGPDGKIRGTAQQVYERYLALGRDASSSGDPIAAESFYQHGEHYYRMLHGAEAAEAERAAERMRRFANSEGQGQPDVVPVEVVSDEGSEESAEELNF
jgi:Domain of unknown function (DUF4167)